MIKCKECGSDDFIHKLFSIVESTRQFSRNGWYCENCGSGPYQIKGASKENIREFVDKLLTGEFK